MKSRVVARSVNFRRTKGLFGNGLLALWCATPLLTASASAQSEPPGELLSEKRTDAVLPDAPGFSRVANGPAGTGRFAEPATLRSMPLNFVKDEVAIFTSPARIRAGDLKWLLPLAGATGAALGTDTYTMRHVVSRSTAFNDASSKSSDVLLGGALGVPVLLFGLGHVRSDEHQREAGLLAGEAIVDAYAFDAVVKYSTLRERPNLNDARGHFFVGDASSSPSFVSGHSIIAWSSAAVLAAEYNKPWQQAGIYTLASGVSLTRVLAQKHFPTDALLGSAAGWLIGHYVYRKHHVTRVVGFTPQKQSVAFQENSTPTLW